jgi:hypothetical protein
MSDDYLWDKSGEPEPEIEQLEELLGSLRYRHPPGGLPLPQRAPVNPRRFFKPALAVAAALLFLTVAAGIWVALYGSGQREKAGVAAITVEPGRAQDLLNPEIMSAMMLNAADNETSKPQQVIIAAAAPRAGGARHSTDFKRRAPSDLQVAAVSEGMAAKEQLIKALHLASSKLNLVQKKVQDSKAIGPES